MSVSSRPAPDFGASLPEISIDTSKRYDVYCSESGVRTVVLFNVLFCGLRKLFGTNQRVDLSPQFLELEQADGHRLFVSRHGIVRFCEHGVQMSLKEVRSLGS